MAALPPIVNAVKAQQLLIKRQREEEGKRMGSDNGPSSVGGASPSGSPSSSSAAASARRSSVGTTAKAEMNYVISMIKGRHVDDFIRWVREAEDVVLLCDQSGNTPLHWAANKGQSDMVAVLLRRNANPKVKNSNGATPLHCAAFSGDSYTIEMLIRAGADPAALNEQGKTFADVCRAKGHTHLEPLLKQVEESIRSAAIAALAQDEETGSNLGLLEGDDAIPPHQWLVPTPTKLSREDLLDRLQQQRAERGGKVGGSPSHPANDRSVSSIASYSANDVSTATSRNDVNRTQPVLRQVSPDIRLPNDLADYLQHGSQSMPAPHRRLDQQQQQQHTALANYPSDKLFEFGGARKQATSQPLMTQQAASSSMPPPPPYSTRASPAQLSAAQFQPQQQEDDIVVTAAVPCCACDGEAKNQASWSCEDCKQADPRFCVFCNACWATEHSSRRSRTHRRARIVVVLPAMESVIGPELRSGIPIDLSQLSPEAKAFILLQQQMLTILNKNAPPAPTPAQTMAMACQTLPPPEMTHRHAQTIDDPRSPFFSDALLELQDIREQLEAEVYHSQQVIDTVRLQMMEALELKHRAEVETLYWRKIVNFRRPPQVVVIYSNQPMPSLLQNIPRQFSYAQSPAAIAPPPPPQVVEPAVVPIRSRRSATCNQSIQCNIRPSAQEGETQTETPSATPPKKKDGLAAVPRYAADAVDLVYGEKHLPDQPQMLLVRWQGGSESWIPAYEVSHCEAVVAYLSRYDRSVVESPMVGERIGSPLDDDERNEVMRQLAMLQRIGTANGSRDSHSAGLANAAFAAGKLLQYGVLPPAFQPAAVIPVDDEALPLPPPSASAANDDDDESPIVERRQRPAALPSSDEALLRQYEDKLRQFEERHLAIRKSREDASERMKKLSEKQQLLDKSKREKVNVEYESQAPVLAVMQPDLPHPLYSTNDRHAALVLQKLQEEVQKVESQHVTAAQYRKSNIKKDGGGGDDGGGSVQREDLMQTAVPLPPSGPASTNVRSTTPPETNVTQPPRHSAAEDKASLAIGGNSSLSTSQQVENKTNRVLYEQYFYKKAGGESPSRLQEPGDHSSSAAGINKKKPPLAPYVMPRAAGGALNTALTMTNEPRPASLN